MTPTPRSIADTRPRILFVTMLNDVGSDRIVAAMGRLGCDCGLIAPPDAFAARSRFVTKLFALPRVGGSWTRGLRLGPLLRGVAREWRPDLVVPLDDSSSRALRDARLRRDPALATLIERSLGRPGAYETICSREEQIALAGALGLRVPPQRRVGSLAEATAAALGLGYPVVLKREQTCGGFGVAIVSDESSLAEAFRQAKRKAATKRAIQTILGLGTANQDAIVLQAYVAGSMAFRVVACDRGEVLDGISFSAECIDPPVTGASTVLRAIDRSDMEAATRDLVAALGCSGLVSLDFILSPEGATLIELNPRPVVSGHLGRLYGHDVYEALIERHAGRPVHQRTGLDEGPETIALFPREIDRDPGSAALDRPGRTLHDLPWDDLDVLEAYATWLERRHPGRKDVLDRRLPRGDVVTQRDLRALVATLDRYPS